jgi:toxin CcdB
MSRQFDVFPNPSRTGREGRPFVVDVQSNRFHDVRTRAIIPLIVTSDVEETPRLTPSFVINGRRLYLQPLEIGILPARLLRNPVANLESERYRIIAAIDLVFTGI